MQLIPPLEHQNLHRSSRSPSPPRHIPTLSSITETTPIEDAAQVVTEEPTYVTDYDSDSDDEDPDMPQLHTGNIDTDSDSDEEWMNTFGKTDRSIFFMKSTHFVHYFRNNY